MNSREPLVCLDALRASKRLADLWRSHEETELVDAAAHETAGVNLEAFEAQLFASLPATVPGAVLLMALAVNRIQDLLPVEMMHADKQAWDVLQTCLTFMANTAMVEGLDPVIRRYLVPELGLAA